MNVVVYGLLANPGALLTQNSRNLGRRPLFLNYPVLYAPPQKPVLAVVGKGSLFTFISLLLRNIVKVASLGCGVTSILATYCRGMNPNLCGNLSLRLGSFGAFVLTLHKKVVPLCRV